MKGISRRTLFQVLLPGVLLTGFILIMLVLLMDGVFMPLYTHRGAERTCPDVTEKTFEEAAAVLKENGLGVMREPDKFDMHYPEGTVLFQNPAPFTVVKKGRRVRLTVSAGTRYIDVPRVTGLSERDAIAEIRKAGLAMGEVLYEINDYYPRGVVCGQSLPEGVPVREASVINITLSIGEAPSRFVAPDVTEKSLDVARRMIGEAGLRVGLVTYSLDSTLIPLTVIRQSVPAGSDVRPGQSINLEVSQLEGYWQQ
ncbi:PASTA domain-containing protein [bacterium]|nr:PASTA domain-containing protein [bacterium]